MPDSRTNAVLNEALIAEARSLLQYVSEAWPWTGTNGQAEQAKIDELAARQRAQVTKLSQLLDRRDWSIEFGSYPTDYTDLHYVALDYLLSQIVDNAKSVLAAVDRAIESCGDDTEAQEVLRQIRTAEKQILDELESSASASASGTAA